MFKRLIHYTSTFNSYLLISFNVFLSLCASFARVALAEILRESLDRRLVCDIEAFHHHVDDACLKTKEKNKEKNILFKDFSKTFQHLKH